MSVIVKSDTKHEGWQLRAFCSLVLFIEFLHHCQITRFYTHACRSSLKRIHDDFYLIFTYYTRFAFSTYMCIYAYICVRNTRISQFRLIHLPF